MSEQGSAVTRPRPVGDAARDGHAALRGDRLDREVGDGAGDEADDGVGPLRRLVVHERGEPGADGPCGERGRTDGADEPRLGRAAQEDLVGDQHRADRRDEHAEDHEPAQEVAPHAGERDADAGDAEQQRQHAHPAADDAAPAHGPVVQAMRADRAEVHEDEDDRERAQQRAGAVGERAAGSCRRRSPARRSRRPRRSTPPVSWATMLATGKAVNAARTASRPLRDQRVKSAVIVPSRRTSP